MSAGGNGAPPTWPAHNDDVGMLNVANPSGFTVGDVVVAGFDPGHAGTPFVIAGVEGSILRLVQLD